MSTFESQNQNFFTEKTVSKNKIKDIWLKYGHKFILALGIVLIAAISFEAGLLRGQKNRAEPIQISAGSGAPNEALPKSIASESTNKEQQNYSSVNSNNELALISENDDKNCSYVASKNSNKFHLSSCQWAKRIKPENKICFPSKEEAEKRGYQGAKCCIK